MSYVELHAHSHYSLLDGASSPEALVARAAALGMQALALTDNDGLYGVVRFHAACRQAGIHPVIGAELRFDDGARLVLLARTQDGYHHLSQLISVGCLAGEKGTPRLPFARLAEHADGLIALSGGRDGSVPRLILAGDRAAALCRARQLAAIFGPGNFWIELQRHLLPGEAALNAVLAQIAGEVGVGLVAANDVRYAERGAADLQDALTCIRAHVSVDEPHPARLANAEYALKAGEELAPLFADYPQALANTARIAARCAVSLDFSQLRLPPFPTPDGTAPMEYLRRLCLEGLYRRYPQPSQRAIAQLAHELGVIERVKLPEFFLIVHDIVVFARSREILCQGRGSAADSLAVYCLGITPIDPLAHNLLFDRFLNEGRTGMPDIDLDLQNDRREEVIRYVYERYGEAHTAMVCNVVTFRPRSALRDLGRVLGFPLAQIDRLAKQIEGWSADAARAAVERLRAADEAAGGAGSGVTEAARAGGAGGGGAAARRAAGQDVPAARSGFRHPRWEQLIRLCEAIDGCPRHLSIHVGGMIITARPLVELVPLERATMPGRVVVQWNKDDVEDAGLIKIDLLALGMLSLVAEAKRLIRAGGEEAPEQEDLPLDDPEIYAMLRRADTIGCFQVESRAQQQMVHRHQPRVFNDIVVQVAIIRPGPIQGNMVHPYLRRRQGLEPVRYLHPKLEPILADTLGIVLYQEQIMQIASEVAGFCAADADRLRRAMSSSRSETAMEALRARFEAGCRATGLSVEDAATLYAQIRGFGQYGFCRSHAACFALLAYQSLWLKRYHPLAFYTALLNNQPMGFYSPAVIVNEARRRGVRFLGVDTRASGVRCAIEEGEIRLGYNYVRRIGSAGQEAIARALAEGPFASVVEFWARTGLDLGAMTALARVGAFEHYGTGRRQLIWDLPLLAAEAAALRGQRILLREADEAAVLPGMGERDYLAAEQEVLGLTVAVHPFRYIRPVLPAWVSAVEALRFVADGTVVTVAGLAVCRQRPGSAKGFVFLTVEDETGLANVIVRPALYERQRGLVRRPLVVVEGILQREGASYSLVGRRFFAVEELAQLEAPPAGYPEQLVHSWR